MTTKHLIQRSLLAAAMLLATAASAHVSIVSGPALASATQEVVFGIGHGCSGQDTLSLRVEVPAAVTSLRTVPSSFGRATLEKGAAGIITAVTWQKSDADVLPDDSAYYKLAIRIRVPNQPFTTLNFPAHQTCRDSEGGTTTVDWVATAAAADGGESAEPVPTLTIVPAHQPGWNKMTVPVSISDMASYFGDALIVWKGQSAYSINPSTREQIAATSDVSVLSALEANDEIWVRY
jgi:uncharacterized protein YcnI